MKKQSSFQQTPPFDLRPASVEEAGLFSSNDERDEALGTVGHLRMDFGSGGKGFYHTWWPHNGDHFNTPEFKEALQEFVDAMRQSGPLKNLAAMNTYCWHNGGEISENDRVYGFVAETEHYRFCLRCTPRPGDYQGYLYCYDLRQQEMARQEKLVGRVTYASGEQQEFCDPQRYLQTIREELPYTLIDLLRQELPENESRQHTETVSLESKSKDMESVLALLPQEKEFITEDGLSGVLTLQLDTVQVEVAGYGSSTREVSATRSYPNLASQDTANIPKTIEDNGRTLTLQNISWQTDNTANTDGYAMGDRFTAVATYTGSATSSYVTGYTVTADYSGTVSRIALNKTRYVAIFEGTAIEPLAPLPDSGSSPVQFNWAYILVPLGVVFAAGGVIGGCLLYKRKHESEEETE